MQNHYSLIVSNDRISSERRNNVDIATVRHRVPANRDLTKIDIIGSGHKTTVMDEMNSFWVVSVFNFYDEFSTRSEFRLIQGRIDMAVGFIFRTDSRFMVTTRWTDPDLKWWKFLS